VLPKVRDGFDGQKVAVTNGRQILVALKRNDEYALNIKVLRRVTLLIENRRNALTSFRI
jgi:hypothetical protein